MSWAIQLKAFFWVESNWTSSASYGLLNGLDEYRRLVTSGALWVTSALRLATLHLGGSSLQLFHSRVTSSWRGLYTPERLRTC